MYPSYSRWLADRRFLAARDFAGAFEHYPNLKWQDTDFMRANHMHDWIHFYDKFEKDISTNQTYELMSYLPYSFIPWYSNFSNHSNATRESALRRCDLDHLADSLLCPFS